jgi:AcrR family transcriptional regulator
MVYSAAQLMRTQGPAATGVREVVERAGAPRGSFQHYFPAGKDQLVGEALLWSGDFAARWVANYPRTTSNPTPGGLFTHMVKFWKDEFTARGYARGCPIMATTADLAGSESAANEQLRTALDQWEGAVIDELVRMTVPRRRARRLATLMISTLEGAVMSARVRHEATPLTTVVAELTPALNAAVD